MSEPFIAHDKSVPNGDESTLREVTVADEQKTTMVDLQKNR